MLGYSALQTTNSNTGTAVGYEALAFNTTGFSNAALGSTTLRANTTGFFNTAVGVQALFANQTGGSCTAVGYAALQNSRGNFNTGVGQSAGTGNDPAWIDGFISASSRGVSVYFFSPDEQQELHFTAQFPHAKKNGTDIKPHLHWSPDNTDTGDVRWGLEYTWTDIGGTFGNTTRIYCEDAGDGTINKHQVCNFPAIDGSGITDVSSMMICRVFRDATNANDDFTGQAGLTEIDFHYEIDTVGSRQEFVK